MAVETNGKLADPTYKGVNGHRSKTPAAKKQKGFNIFSILTRYRWLLR